MYEQKLVSELAKTMKKPLHRYWYKFFFFLCLTPFVTILIYGMWGPLLWVLLIATGLFMICFALLYAAIGFYEKGWPE